MSYILFYDKKKVIGIEKKQPNRQYFTQYSMKEVETEDELISEIKKIDENYVYKTEEDRKKEREERMNKITNETPHEQI